MGVIDDSIELKTDVQATDPLLEAAETAWLEYAKGTYSGTDKRIFNRRISSWLVRTF